MKKKFTNQNFLHINWRDKTVACTWYLCCAVASLPSGLAGATSISFAAFFCVTLDALTGLAFTHICTPGLETVVTIVLHPYCTRRQTILRGSSRGSSTTPIPTTIISTAASFHTTTMCKWVWSWWARLKPGIWRPNNPIWKYTKLEISLKLGCVFYVS